MIYEEKLTQTEGDDDIEIKEQRAKQGGELDQLEEVIEMETELAAQTWTFADLPRP